MAETRLKVIIDLLDDAAKQGLNEFSNLAERVGTNLVNVGQNLKAGITDPIVGLGTAAAKSAIEFESGFAQVTKSLDELTPKQTDALENSLLGLTRTIPLTANQINELATSGAQFGVEFSALPGFTNDVARAAAALDLETDKAGKSFAVMSNIFGFGLDSIPVVAGNFNILSNEMAATSSDILNVTTRTAGLASQVGLSVEQTAALGASMLALGKTPEIAATGINALLSKMSTASIQSERFGDGLKLVGLTAQEMETAIRTDAQGAILDLLGTIRQLDPEKQSKALGLLFGAEYSDDIASLVGGLDQLENAFGLVGNEAAALESIQREFDIQSGTTANQLVLLKNNLTELGIRVGNAIIPALVTILELVRPIILAIADFAAANPTLTAIAVGVLAIAAAIPPLIILIGTTISAWGTLTAAWAAAPAIIAAVKVGLGGIGATLSVGLFPVLALAVVKIAGIIAALKLWYEVMTAYAANWDDVVLGIGYTFEQIGSTIVSTIIGIVEWLGNATISFFNLEGAAADFVNGTVQNFNALVTLISQFIGGLTHTIYVFFKTLPEGLGAALDAAKAELIDFFQFGVPEIYENFLQNTANTTAQFSQAFDEASAKVPDSVKGAIGGAVGVLTGQNSVFFNAGAGLIFSLIKGVNSRLPELLDTISSATSKVRDFLPFSPSKVGALSDLDKVDLFGTMGENIERSPIVSQVANTTGSIRDELGGGGVSTVPNAGGGGGGSVTVAPSYTINIGSGTGENAVDDIIARLEERDRELLDLVDRALNRYRIIPGY